MKAYVIVLLAHVSVADDKGNPLPGYTTHSLHFRIQAKDDAEAAAKLAYALNSAAHRAVPGIDLG